MNEAVEAGTGSNESERGQGVLLGEHFTFSDHGTFYGSN